MIYLTLPNSIPAGQKPGRPRDPGSVAGSRVPCALLGLFLCAALSAQPISKAGADVTGWTSTKWGMTAAQVRAAVPYPTEQDPDSKNLQIVPPIQIGRIPVRVDFDFTDGKLTLVGLTAIHAEDHVTANGAFASLKRSLIEKYGKPSDEQTRTDTSGTTQEVFWSFPSTQIVLRLIDWRFLASAMITYAPSEKNSPL